MVEIRYDHDGPFDPPPSVVAIGVFDGVHRGHQAVLSEVVALANMRGHTPSVITFSPHPLAVLQPDKKIKLIQTLEQRISALGAVGIERVRVITFDANTAMESPEDFVNRHVVSELHTSGVVIGEDFHFGHNRAGNVTVLRDMGQVHGFSVNPAVIVGGVQRWSSTAIRHALRQGDVDGASEILGRPFVLRGTVVHGDARGRDLGYPTANLACIEGQLIPGIGIYAASVRLPDGHWWPAAVSIGTRPQFYEDGDLLVEVHIPGFAGDLYDAELNVAFLQRLRGEMTFASVEDLVAQIDRDVEQTTEIFKKFSPEAHELLR